MTRPTNVEFLKFGCAPSWKGPYSPFLASGTRFGNLTLCGFVWEVRRLGFELRELGILN